ncbi:MAG: hypothetical protein EXR93_08650 [Gemmatimonadetes bacterium]|nr:hypothetical protein [Gemmatimonadota bacterium]
MAAESFYQVFSETFLVISQVAIVVGGAWILTVRGIIRQDLVKGMSDITVVVFLPCLMFSNIIDTLNPAVQPLWWVVPLIALAFFTGTTLLAALAFAGVSFKEKRDLIPLAAMQNAAYIVLPIGQVLIPRDFDRFALYCFLYVLAYNPLLWSVGKFFNTSSLGRPFAWRELITPPFAANLTAVMLVLTGARAWIPHPVNAAIELVGSATIPVSLVVLGATLGGMAHRFRFHLSDAIRTLSVKLVLIPLVVVLVLSATTLKQTDPTLALVLVLQGASAPAMNIILQIRTYGGNLERTGTIMVMGYIAALFTIPAWVAVWQVMG